MPRPPAQDEYEEQVRQAYPGYPGPAQQGSAPLPQGPAYTPRSIPLAPEGVESPLANWARRLIIGPRSIVERTLAEEAQTRRATAKSQEAVQTEARRAAQAQSNLLLNLREAARLRREDEAAKETRAQAGRDRLTRAILATLPAPEGKPEMAPRPEEMIREPGGLDAYKALQGQAGVQWDPSKPLVNPRTGQVIKPAAETAPPTKPEPFKDYNPVTQEPFWNEGKRRWDIKNKSVSDMELLASQAARMFPGNQAQQEQWILDQGLARQKAIAGVKAEGAYPYRPLTEPEQRSMDWIEGLSTLTNRFEQFTPEQLQAVTTLPGWLKAKGKTTFKGMLPQVFGAPGQAEQTFAAIESLMAEAEQLGFKLGGQQLTPMEKETVMAFVPNRGDLINPVVLAAKLGNLRTSLAIIKEMRMWRMSTPRGALSPEVYDQALKRALAEGGVKVLKAEPAPAPTSAPKGSKWE